jgi:hypothetical protein
MTKRIKSIILLWLFAGIVLMTAVSSISCDRVIQVTGKVYEWTNAPDDAKSSIYHKEYSSLGLLKEDLPEGLELKPLKDAAVRCYGKVNDTKTFYSNDVTDEKGEFRVIVSLGQNMDEYPATIEVVKNGYITVKREVIERGDAHLVNAVLVRRGG